MRILAPTHTSRLFDSMLWKQSVRALVLLLLCTCCPKASDYGEPAALAPEGLIDFQYGQPAGHAFNGIGVALYAQEIHLLPRLQELNIRYVRVEAGPSWGSLPMEPPPGGSALSRYVARNFNYQDPERMQRFRLAFDWFQRHDIKVVLVIYQQPYSWLQADYMKTFRPGAEYRLVELWVSLLDFYGENGMVVHYVELANEPEGNWNGHIPAQRYYDAVVHARKRFDESGQQGVGILGPGLSSLNLEGRASRWIRSMPPLAEQALEVFSLHAWDEIHSNEVSLNYIRGAWKEPARAFREKNPDKEIFLTEFASEVSRDLPARLHSPGSGALFTAAETEAYALRSMANTLIHINQGVSVPIFWRLSDLDGDSASWGLIRSPEKGGGLRPAYRALGFLSSRMPAPAKVFLPDKPNNHPEIATLMLKEEGSKYWFGVHTGPVPVQIRIRDHNGANQNLKAELYTGGHVSRLPINPKTLSFVLPAKSIVAISWN
jgi:hypothetical protein